MAFKPRFNMALRRGVKILACVDIFLSIAVAIFASTILIRWLFYPGPRTQLSFKLNYNDLKELKNTFEQTYNHLKQLKKVTKITITFYDFIMFLLWIPIYLAKAAAWLLLPILVELLKAFILLCYAIIPLFLSATLYSGANQRNPEKCVAWLCITIFNTVICCLTSAFDDDKLLEKITFFCTLVRVFYTICEIAVVGSFIKELKCVDRSSENADINGIESGSFKTTVLTTSRSQTPPPDYSTIAEP